MKTIDLIICLLFAFVLTVSCDNEKEKKQIYPNVEFVYLGKGMEFMNALSSLDKIPYSLCVDTVVTDSLFVRKFIELVDSLEDDTSKHSIDIRVVSKIHYADSTERLVCFGDYWGTMVEKDVKKDNPQLFELINNALYDEKGWRKIFTHSLRQDGFDDNLDALEMQTMIDEYMERVRKAGDVYPK